MSKQNISKQIKLKNVQLDYNSLFVPSTADPKFALKYSADFILCKKIHKDQIEIINEIIRTLAKEAEIKLSNLGLKEICFKDSDISEDKYFPDTFRLRAKSSVDFKPQVIDRKLDILEEDTGLIKRGSIVNAVVLIYAYAGGIRGIVNAVQYVSDDSIFEIQQRSYSSQFEQLNDEEVEEIPF